MGVRVEGVAGSRACVGVWAEAEECGGGWKQNSMAVAVAVGDGEAGTGGEGVWARNKAV